MKARPAVFVGSSTEGLPIARALQVLLDYSCEVEIWSQGIFGLSQGGLESLVLALNRFDFAVLVLSAVDLILKRGETVAAPRDNVLFELGLFTGGLGRERTYMVYERSKAPELPTDLAGITAATFELHSSGNLEASLGAAANTIQQQIQRLGFRERREAGTRQRTIKGRRLFEYEGLYPVDIAPRTNLPSLNSDTYVHALRYFLKEDVHDRLAAMDLVYLREDNRQHLGDVLPTEETNPYEQLIDKYSLEEFQVTYSQEARGLFRNVERIVNDLGDTLSGVNFEVLLHDVRNPLRSIIAVKNAFSGRRLYDPSTRFVVQYVRHQGKHLIEAMQSGSLVAYPKQFTQGKRVKATTTPLYDDRYGLIGILCLNIDIETIGAFDEDERMRFFDNYARTFGETPVWEREEAPVG